MVVQAEKMKKAVEEKSVPSISEFIENVKGELLILKVKLLGLIFPFNFLRKIYNPSNNYKQRNDDIGSFCGLRIRFRIKVT